MPWTHHIFKHTDRTKRASYGLFEVHYSESGKIKGYTQNPLTGWYDSPKELLEDLDFMREAVAKKIKDKKYKYKEISKIKFKY